MSLSFARRNWPTISSRQLRSIGRSQFENRLAQAVIGKRAHAEVAVGEKRFEAQREHAIPGCAANFALMRLAPSNGFTGGFGSRSFLFHCPMIAEKS